MKFLIAADANEALALAKTLLMRNISTANGPVTRGVAGGDTGGEVGGGVGSVAGGVASGDAGGDAGNAALFSAPKITVIPDGVSVIIRTD
jgi:hypothetical protein